MIHHLFILAFINYGNLNLVIYCKHAGNQLLSQKKTLILKILSIMLYQIQAKVVPEKISKSL